MCKCSYSSGTDQLRLKGWSYRLRCISRCVGVSVWEAITSVPKDRAALSPGACLCKSSHDSGPRQPRRAGSCCRLSLVSHRVMFVHVSVAVQAAASNPKPKAASPWCAGVALCEQKILHARCSSAARMLTRRNPPSTPRARKSRSVGQSHVVRASACVVFTRHVRLHRCRRMPDSSGLDCCIRSSESICSSAIWSRHCS